MDAKNMTAKQLANMTLEEFNNLNLKQAQDALTILNRAVNKSMRRAEKAGRVATGAPAYRAMQQLGGKLKTRGYSGASGLNMAKAEIKRAMDYLNAKTRTVTGAKKHRAQAARHFGLPENTAPEEISRISEEIDEILDEFPAEYANMIKQSYEVIQQQISERLQKGNTPDEIRQALRNQYERVKSGELDQVENYEKSLWSKFESELDESLQQLWTM